MIKKNIFLFLVLNIHYIFVMENNNGDELHSNEIFQIISADLKEFAENNLFAQIDTVISFDKEFNEYLQQCNQECIAAQAQLKEDSRKIIPENPFHFLIQPFYNEEEFQTIFESKEEANHSQLSAYNQDNKMPGTHKNINITKKSSYSCTHCDKKFCTKTEADDHFARKHQNGKPYGCANCIHSYSTKRSLNLHVQRKHGTQNFFCKEKECKNLDGFALWGDLNQHYKRKHSCNAPSKDSLLNSNKKIMKNRIACTQNESNKHLEKLCEK